MAQKRLLARTTGRARLGAMLVPVEERRIIITSAGGAATVEMATPLSLTMNLPFQMPQNQDLREIALDIHHGQRVRGLRTRSWWVMVRSLQHLRRDTTLMMEPTMRERRSSQLFAQADLAGAVARQPRLCVNSSIRRRGRTVRSWQGLRAVWSYQS